MALTLFEAERAIIDKDGAAEQRFHDIAGDNAQALLQQARAKLVPAGSIAAFEARARYAWIDKLVAEVEIRSARKRTLVDHIDLLTSHP